MSSIVFSFNIILPLFYIERRQERPTKRARLDEEVDASSEGLISSHENSEDEDEREDYSEDEANQFLGINPVTNDTLELDIRSDLTDRVSNWIKKGIDKEEKKRILSEIPKKGKNICLEAPILNDEITSYKSISRDEHFKSYQGSAGSILAATVNALSMILDDTKVPINRNFLLKNLSDAVKLSADLYFCLNDTRKIFASGVFQEKYRKKLRKSESTNYLFGDDVKSVFDSVRTIEKIDRDARPSYKPLRQINYQASNALNFGGSTNREVVRSSRRNHLPRNTSTTTSSSRTPSRGQHSKRSYSQTRPHQGHRSRR